MTHASVNDQHLTPQHGQAGDIQLNLSTVRLLVQMLELVHSTLAATTSNYCFVAFYFFGALVNIVLYFGAI